MMPKAKWRDCAGMADPREHMMRDHCWNCAPFWERIPVCPNCGRKLEKTGKTKCRGCGTFVKVEEEGYYA